MFGNTLIIPLSSGSKTLVKVKTEGYSSEYIYKDALQSIVCKIRHTKSGGTGSKPLMDRHNVEFVRTTFATLTTAAVVQKAYFVMEQSNNDTAYELMDALADWAIATANSNLISVVAWES